MLHDIAQVLRQGVVYFVRFWVERRLPFAVDIRTTKVQEGTRSTPR